MEIVLNTVKIFPTFQNRCYFCMPKILILYMYNKLIFAFLTAVVFTSCMGSYNIEGTTDVSRLNGRMLYLKVFTENDMQNIDSCDVVHGKFHFSGSVDSAKLGNVFMDDVRLMPLMLEAGNISIKIDQTGQLQLSGTPLNDSLYQFMHRYDTFQQQLAELEHKPYQGIMNGSDMQQVMKEVNEEAFRINAEIDRLVTGFITENIDNALGPGVFQIVTSGYQYPEMKPWIVSIMAKATDSFKNNDYVKLYVSEAQHFQNLQNGLETPPNQPQGVAQQQSGPQETPTASTGAAQ